MAYNKIPANCPYGLSKYKTFRGHDGLGFEVVVTLNKKPQFVAVDDGWGGGLAYHGVKATNSHEAFVASQRDMDAAVKAMHEYAKALPPYDPDDLFPAGLPMDAELLIEEMVNKLEEEKVREKNRKMFAKLIAKETLFRLKGDKPGTWRSILSIDPGVAPRLRTKHGETLQVILNDALLADPNAWERY